MVYKHGVVLEFFDLRARPTYVKFDKMQIWARVVNLPFNRLMPPWPERIAKMMGR
jgi:hypothetical protein